MTASDFFSIISTLFAFLPSWFTLIFFALLSILIVFILFRVVAFVMDVLPFV